MELLLVIGMMVVVIGMAGLWVQRGMFSANARPAEELFYIASAEARIAAMSGGRPVSLRFDEPAQSFVVEVVPGQDALLSQWSGADPLPWQERDNRRAAGSSDAASGQWGSGAAGSAVPAQNASEQGGGGQTRLGATSVTAGQPTRFALAEGSEVRVRFYALNQADGTVLAEPLEAITFHPAGASTPVEVVMESGGRSGQRQVLRPDSFATGEAHTDTATARRSGVTAGAGSSATGGLGGRW